MAWCASISSSLWHRHSKLILYFHTTGSIFSEDSFGVLYCLQADNPARLRRAVQQGNLGTVRRFIRDKEAKWDGSGVAAACFCSTLYLAMLQYAAVNSVNSQWIVTCQMWRSVCVTSIPRKKKCLRQSSWRSFRHRAISFPWHCKANAGWKWSSCCFKAEQKQTSWDRLASSCKFYSWVKFSDRNFHSMQADAASTHLVKMDGVLCTVQSRKLIPARLSRSDCCYLVIWYKKI